MRIDQPGCSNARSSATVATTTIMKDCAIPGHLPGARLAGMIRKSVSNGHTAAAPLPKAGPCHCALGNFRQRLSNMATILIVDDHVLNREMLMMALDYGEHRLLEAADGLQALKLVSAERPDLVITDI